MDDPDRNDMRDLCEGQDAALNRIMDRWSAPLGAFIHRYLQDREDAFDLLQETFVRVYQNRDRYRPDAKFSTWLFAIAVNLCRNRARWRRRHPTVSLDAGAEEGIPSCLNASKSGEQSPDAALVQRERIRAVREAIARLSHDLRTPLILFQYEGLTHQEIAGVMNCTPKAVETRIYRARRKLKAWLADIDQARPSPAP